MILIDSAEPEEIEQLLSQSTPTSRQALNLTSRSDYYFGGEDSKTRQFGRVQVAELLSNIDSMEDELRRYYNNADENYQIIEGIISDVSLSRKDKSSDVSVKFRKALKPQCLYSYRVAANGYLFGEHIHNVRADMLYAWIFRLSECGIITFFTHNFVGTAKLLAAIYNNCQKTPDAHTTLNRYYIPQIALKQVESKRVSIREQNPFIKSLIAMSLIYHLDIGEKKATALYDAGYKSFFDLAYASLSELTAIKGFGKLTAYKLLSTLGVDV